MKAAISWMGVVGMIVMAGCASPAKAPVPDASAAIVPASEEQQLLGNRRAASIYERWSEEKRTELLKSTTPHLAVKTLGLTPEQLNSLGGKISSPETAICVVIWDAKTKKLVASECYVAVTPPALGQPARFGPHTAQYVGSL